MTRVNQKVVQTLQPPAKGNRITYDCDLKGFGVRITASGHKAFVLNYRFEGRERRLTIGSWPEWSANSARAHAEKLKRMVDTGIDPLSRKQERRASPNFSDLCSIYAEKHLPKKRPSSQRNDRSMLENLILPRLAREKVVDIRHKDIEELHSQISEKTPFRANRAVALLSKIFSLAIRWEMRPDNPAKGIEKNLECPRERYLNEIERQSLARELSGRTDHAAKAISLLLLTGARKTEVLSAKWEQFDLDRATWTKRSADTKQSRGHHVPINVGAVSLLKNHRDQQLTLGPLGTFLFPSRSSTGHLVDVKKAWSAICGRAGIEGVRLHDLRHSFASRIISRGRTLSELGALLGHSQPQTTSRYAHLEENPLRAAAQEADI